MPVLRRAQACVGLVATTFLCSPSSIPSGVRLLPQAKVAARSGERTHANRSVMPDVLARRPLAVDCVSRARLAGNGYLSAHLPGCTLRKYATIQKR